MKMVAIRSSILFSSPLGRSLQGECALRSTCGGRWRGRTRRTPAWRSTSAGRWRGKPVGLLEGGGGSCSGHLLLEVQGDVAELLLDVTDNLPLGSGGEGVAPLGEDLHQVVGELTASQVQTDDGVGESVTLVDGDAVGDTVA